MNIIDIQWHSMLIKQNKVCNWSCVNINVQKGSSEWTIQCWDLENSHVLIRHAGTTPQTSIDVPSLGSARRPVKKNCKTLFVCYIDEVFSLTNSPLSCSIRPLSDSLNCLFPFSFYTNTLSTWPLSFHHLNIL